MEHVAQAGKETKGPCIELILSTWKLFATGLLCKLDC